MSTQTNTAPKTMTDEELDGVSGGVVGFNPLYANHTDLAGNVAPVYTPTHEIAPVPQAPAPTHDTSVVPVSLSGPLNNGSLDIAHQAITSALHISSTMTVSGTPVAPPEQSPVSVLTLGTPTPTYTTVTATVDGLRSANGNSAHVGAHSSMENAFDLSLVKGVGISS